MNLLRRLELVVLPPWVGAPVVLYGLCFLFFWPFGLMDWYAFVVVTIAGLVSAWWVWWRYELTVIERSENGVILRFGRKDRSPDDT